MKGYTASNSLVRPSACFFKRWSKWLREQDRMYLDDGSEHNKSEEEEEEEEEACKNKSNNQSNNTNLY